MANTNTFQIIGGEYRGRKFGFPDADGLRPTSSKVRETLFNWIQFESFNKTYLDLFAGSGALSFEALSRGAKQVTTIERNL
ncbi:MAG TPA: 16S rRNA (guanine(966)-N(2))-methyltransferase RsmD, partial [Gammaproteobacteria bacterium]|nr:16S rRNA (guanine(966)-N(2))-methyltransferase RsmD [Gammaproteobacteria bacterium]